MLDRFISQTEKHSCDGVAWIKKMIEERKNDVENSTIDLVTCFEQNRQGTIYLFSLHLGLLTTSRGVVWDGDWGGDRGFLWLKEIFHSIMLANRHSTNTVENL